MKFLYLDCFSGISGDMAVGALIDAGVPLDVLRSGLALLGFDKHVVSLDTRAIKRSEITATKFDVHDHAHTHDDDHAHEHSHGSDGTHSHVHGEHAHTHTHTHATRSYSDIAHMISQSALPQRVRDRSIAIFRAIGIAEARIHGTDLDHVHFHEVGAVDSIADIVAFALCLEHLGIDEVYSSPIPLGSGGFVRTQHGRMPLPAPATLEILKDYPVTLTDVPFELTTPTGAGIIKALSRGQLSFDHVKVDHVGFGAGTRDLADRPNLLRAIVGRLDSELDSDTVTKIECNIDDLNPQVYPHVFDLLFAAGANDVFLTNVVMKKGRPGHLLSILCMAGDIEELTRIVMAETTTIGVRYSEHRRRKLAREEVTVDTEFGPVRMKRMTLDGSHRTAAEHDEARRIAIEHAIPLHVVMQRLQEIASAFDFSS
ncbi:MAG: nickel pincer cofactor biosynthesis protein LarC [bacterium]|nr:nickel pincer cofactor biosynthesis protein LarC [Candidatus Kapabacteria bacterium]